MGAVSCGSGLLTAIVGVIEDRDQEIAPTRTGVAVLKERSPDRDAGWKIAIRRSLPVRPGRRVIGWVEVPTWASQ